MAPLTQFAPVESTALTGSDQNVETTPCTLHGITVRETAGSTAAVRIYDNASANSGTILLEVALAANASEDIWYERGKKATAGVRVDIVSGTVEGSVATSRAI